MIFDENYVSDNVDLIKKLGNIAVVKGYELPRCKIVKAGDESYTCTIEFLAHIIETKAATEDLALYLCVSNMLILCECPYELLKSSTDKIRKISVTFKDEEMCKPAEKIEDKFNPSRKLDPVSFLNGFARKTKEKLPEYRTGMLPCKDFSVMCCFLGRITEGSSVKKKVAKKNAAFEMIKTIGLDKSKIIDYSPVPVVNNV